MESILAREENGGDAAVGFGDYPNGCHTVLEEAVIVVSRQQAGALLECLVVGLLVLVIHVSPVPLDVAVERCLDAGGKVGDDSTILLYLRISSDQVRKASRYMPIRKGYSRSILETVMIIDERESLAFD